MIPIEGPSYITVLSYWGVPLLCLHYAERRQSLDLTLTEKKTIRNEISKGSSIRVNIAYILHGTIYSIFAYYMRTVQSNFRNLIILTECTTTSSSLKPYLARMGRSTSAEVLCGLAFTQTVLRLGRSRRNSTNRCNRT